MRIALLAPLLLLLLTGCPEKEEIQNLEEADKSEQLQIKEKLEIQGKEVQKNSEKMKKNLEKLNLQKRELEKSIKTTGKTALELVDECIDSQKSKGLPIYECTKLLKP